jgi:hypothetical protein
MVLAAKGVARVALGVAGAVHVDGGDAEVVRALRGLGDAAAAVDRALQLDVGSPAVAHAGFHQAGQRLVQRAARATLAVEPALGFGARRHVPHFRQEGNALQDQFFAFFDHGFSPPT